MPEEFMADTMLIKCELLQAAQQCFFLGKLVVLHILKGPN